MIEAFARTARAAVDATAPGEVGLRDDGHVLSREHRTAIERSDDDVDTGRLEDRAAIRDLADPIDCDTLVDENLLDPICGAGSFRGDEDLEPVAFQRVQSL